MPRRLRGIFAWVDIKLLLVSRCTALKQKHKGGFIFEAK